MTDWGWIRRNSWRWKWGCRWRAHKRCPRCREAPHTACQRWWCLELAIVLRLETINVRDLVILLATTRRLGYGKTGVVDDDAVHPLVHEAHEGAQLSRCKSHFNCRSKSWWLHCFNPTLSSWCISNAKTPEDKRTRSPRIASTLCTRTLVPLEKKGRNRGKWRSGPWRCKNKDSHLLLYTGNLGQGLVQKLQLSFGLKTLLQGLLIP